MDLRYLPEILRPLLTYESFVLGSSFLIAGYLYCVIELFWEGRWKQTYLPWACAAGLVGLVLGGLFFREPASIFMGMLFVVLDVCMVSCLVVDLFSRW